MNLFALSGLSVGIASTALISANLFFGRSKTHRAFMLFYIAVAAWGFGLFFVGISKDGANALLAWRLTNVGGIFIAPLFYGLITVFCEVRRRLLLPFGYLAAFICSVLVVGTDIPFNRTREVFGLHYLDPNPLYLAAIGLYVIFVLLSYVELLRILPKVKGQKRLQALYMALGSLFGFVGGTTTFLPMYKMDFFYPLGNFGITIYCLVLGYAIFRHRLMDFHVVFRKSLVYSLSVGLLTGIFVALVLALTRFFSGYSGLSSFGITLVAALIIAFVFAPLRNQVQNLVDRVFFRSTYDYYTIVKNTSRELLSTIDLEKICGLIVNTALETLKLKRALLMSSRNGVFETVYSVEARGQGSRGEVRPPSHLDRGSALAEMLRAEMVVLSDELLYTVEETEARRAASELASLACEAAVPIVIEGEPAFLLLLGGKRSGDSFSAEDINLLGTMSNQAAIALKNATLYSELEQRNQDLKREMAEHQRAEREKRELQEKLLHSEKMEVIGRLAGGVAHDLNNVLTAVVAYPDLILMGLPEDSPHKRHLLTIQRSGLKAAAIVRDLLTLARRGVKAKEISELNSLVKEYISSPECETLKAYHPKVAIREDLDPDLWNIEGSPVHIFKTIMNLVSNAAEAQPAGGEIVISTYNRSLAGRCEGHEATLDEGDYVVLEVSDNGIGISPDECKKIFEPFYTKKTMGRSGTGLGMAVVWGTVEDHNGSINVQSVEGKGTTFTLYFPRTLKFAGKDEVVVPAEEYLGKGEKILVVDDMREQRELARDLLMKLGYEVSTVGSGEEAVEYMEKSDADLLVLDMIMDPGIDGLDTYRRILELRPRTRAIIASGFAETQRVRETIELGAGEYIMKPFTLRKIGAAVRAELEQKPKRF